MARSTERRHRSIRTRDTDRGVVLRGRRHRARRARARTSRSCSSRSSRPSRSARAPGLGLSVSYGIVRSYGGHDRLPPRPTRRRDLLLRAARSAAERPRKQRNDRTPLLHRFHHCTTFDATVVAIEDDRRPSVGRARSHRVLSHVRRPAVRHGHARRRARSSTSIDRDDGTIAHVIDGRAGGRATVVRGEIDWPRRLRSHAAAHRPARAVGGVRSAASASARSASISAPRRSTIDLAREVTPAEIAAAEHAGQPGRLGGPAGRASGSRPRKRPRGCRCGRSRRVPGTLRLIDVTGLRSVGLRRHARRRARA